MIKSFSAKNYKAFDKFNLELKPITILIGANSCGKSAIINSLLMLSQSADSLNISDSIFRMNGDKVGMGEPLNLFKNKDSNNNLEFSFSLSQPQKAEIIDKINAYKRELIKSIYMFSHFLLSKFDNKKEYQNTQKINMINILGEGTFNEKQYKTVSGYILDIISYVRKNDENINKEFELPQGIHNFFFSYDKSVIKNCIEKLLPISAKKIVPESLSYTFKYTPENDLISLSSVKLKNEFNETIFETSLLKKTTINSDVFSKPVLNACKRDLIPLMNKNSLSFINISPSNGYNTFYKDAVNPSAAYICNIISFATNELIKSLCGHNINHVSPLRAFPQRYYLLDRTVQHTALNSSDGNELAEILKKNPSIKDSINILLSEFNLAVEIEKVNNIIHKIIINQDSVDLELTDVGFGISQVLPILVQAYLSPKNSITIIEQPEIHLHPKMQAWLIDAIIKISISENKIFIIESHSDAIIRRMRLRILDDNSELTSDHVALYHLERDRTSESSLLNRIEINSSGDVSWPTGFMDTEINDIIAIEKLKADKNRNKI